VHTLLLGAVIISFAPILVRASDLPADTMGFYRMLIGLGWFAGASLLLGSAKLPPAQRRLALLAGVAFALDLICWHRAIHLLGPGVATLLANLQVLLVAAYMAWRGGSEAPRRLFWLALPLALAGLTLIVTASAQPHRYLLPGLMLGLAAAGAYATYLILLKGVAQNSLAQSNQVMLRVAISGTLVMGTVTLLQHGTLQLPDSASQWSYLLLYGLLVQGIAWSLIARAMQRVPAVLVSLLLLLQPALALVWDMLWFAHPFSWQELAGVGLTLVAIALGVLSSARFNATQPSPTQPPVLADLPNLPELGAISEWVELPQPESKPLL